MQNIFRIDIFSKRSLLRTIKLFVLKDQTLIEIARGSKFFVIKLYELVLLVAASFAYALINYFAKFQVKLPDETKTKN